MHPTPGSIAALFAGGLFAGVVNVMAGGGSLVTLPLLVFLGVPPTVANGTNRVALLLQNTTAVAGFHRAGRLPWRLTGRTVIATLLGAAVGAVVASRLSNEAFRPILGVILIVMAAFLLLGPSRWLEPKGDPERPLGWRMHLAFFGIGIWGGFIQAGIGFFILAALVLGLGLDLVRANGVKVALVLIYTVLALGVFALEGKVDWIAGAILAAGNGLGGYLGARLSIRKGATWIRWFLVAAVVVSALQILGVFEAVGRLLG